MSKKVSKAIDLLDLVQKNKVDFLKYNFVDINGVLKSCEVMTNNLKDIKSMNYKVMFDGSSVKGYGKITKSDLYLVPDVNTFSIDEFENVDGKHNVASVFCNIQYLDGRHHPNCGRSLLIEGLNSLKEINLSSMNLAFEPEFFLFKKDSTSHALTPIDNGEYFDGSDRNEGTTICREIAYLVEKSGMIIEKISHEVANGQFEVNYKYDDALKACDNFIKFRSIVKFVALKHGYIASFMPKPIQYQNGSGLHTNVSLNDKNGKNAFAGDEKSLSTIGNQFLSGVLKHSRAIALMTNSCVNSYKRLIKGFEAPVYVAYSDHNRTTLARIPATRGGGARIEVRNVDASGNPYYIAASVLLSGIDGIKSKLTNNLKVNENIFDFSYAELVKKGIEALPENLNEAISEFENSKFIQKAFSSEFILNVVKIKTLESLEYKKHVSDWEIKHYISI